MAKQFSLKKDIVIPIVPQKIENFETVRDILFKFQQCLTNLTKAENAGIISGDSKVAVGMDNIDELLVLVD